MCYSTLDLRLVREGKLVAVSLSRLEDSWSKVSILVSAEYQ